MLFGRNSALYLGRESSYGQSLALDDFIGESVSGKSYERRPFYVRAGSRPRMIQDRIINNFITGSQIDESTHNQGNRRVEGNYSTYLCTKGIGRLLWRDLLSLGNTSPVFLDTGTVVSNKFTGNCPVIGQLGNTINSMSMFQTLTRGNIGLLLSGMIVNQFSVNLSSPDSLVDLNLGLIGKEESWKQVSDIEFNRKGTRADFESNEIETGYSDYVTGGIGKSFNPIADLGDYYPGWSAVLKLVKANGAKTRLRLVESGLTNDTIPHIGVGATDYLTVPTDEQDIANDVTNPPRRFHSFNFTVNKGLAFPSALSGGTTLGQPINTSKRSVTGSFVLDFDLQATDQLGSMEFINDVWFETVNMYHLVVSLNNTGSGKIGEISNLKNDQSSDNLPLKKANQISFIFPYVRLTGEGTPGNIPEGRIPLTVNFIAQKPPSDYVYTSLNPVAFDDLQVVANSEMAISYWDDEIYAAHVS